MFTAPGVDKHISGVIMYDETARDTNAKGDK
jgi:fructose-bisphosphate aldolase class 1